MSEAMMETTKPGAIFRAIAGVMEDVGAVYKDKVNKQQGFKFRSIDDVYNALHPALVKNKVFIVPFIKKQERDVLTTKNGTQMFHVICTIHFTFYAEDGSSIETELIGEALDTGDKAINKAMAIAYKYACFQVFCIPTEEMVDPDAERPELEEEKKSGKKTKNPGAAKKSPEKEMTAPAQAQPAEPEAKPTDKITPEMLKTIRAEQERTGVKDSTILSRQKVKAQSMEELTLEEFKYIMGIFQVTPTLGGEKNE